MMAADYRRSRATVSRVAQSRAGQRSGPDLAAWLVARQRRVGQGRGREVPGEQPLAWEGPAASLGSAAGWGRPAGVAGLPAAPGLAGAQRCLAVEWCCLAVEWCYPAGERCCPAGESC